MNASRALILCFAAVLILAGAMMSESALAETFMWGGSYGSEGGQNWATCIKSQFGGTCWAFGSVATFESKYMLTRNDTSYQPDLSEQQLVWETSPDLGDNNGGHEDQALSYMTTHGVVLDSAVPHDPHNENVPSPTDPWPLASVFADGTASHLFVGSGETSHFSTGNTTAGLKAALKQYGPLCVAILAGSDLYSSPQDLINRYSADTSTSTDHAVELVGWVDDTSGDLPGGIQGYWIIKNSWGTGEGNAGYDVVPFSGTGSTKSSIERKNAADEETGPVWYTGAMKSVTWTGTGSSGPIWTTATQAGYRNWSDGLAWVNQETAATFDNSSPGSSHAISIVNTVIAHQLTFSSDASPTYVFNNGSNGGLTVTAGGIQANSNVTINVPVTVGAPQTWTAASGVTLNITQAVHTIISNLTIAGAGNTTIGGPIDGGGVINIGDGSGGAAPGNLIMSGTGVLTLSGASNYTGSITGSSGTLSFAPGLGVTATYGGTSSSSSGTGTISGSGAMQMNGLGTVVIGGTDTGYTGAVTVNQGQLTMNNYRALGTTSTAVTISGGQVNCNYGGTTTSKPFNISGGGVLNQVTGSGTFSGAVTCSGAAEIRNSSSGGTMTLSNATPISGNMGGGGLTLNAAGGGAIVVNNNINVSNSSGVTFSNGTIALGGAANSWAGNTTVNNGVLLPKAANNLPSATNVTLNNGTLNMNGYSQSLASVTSLSPATDLITSSTAATLTLTPTVDKTYAGNITNAVALTKNGLNRLTLTGTNTYSGQTTMTNGALELGLNAQSPILTSGGTDLQTGAIVFDYAGGADPIGTIQGLLDYSNDGGLWDRGQFRDTQAVVLGMTLGCVDDTLGQTVTVMATYPGDSNLDGMVNGKDMATWSKNVFSGSTWAQGDVNGDGVVNGLDRDLIIANTGRPPLGISPGSHLTAAPEPTTLGLLVVALLGLSFCSRRTRYLCLWSMPMKSLAHFRRMRASRFALRVFFCSMLLGLASATPLLADEYWLGTFGTDWNNPLNWSGGYVPGSSDVTWINTEQNGAPNPWENGTDTVSALHIGSQGDTLNGAGTMTICNTGNLTVLNELWVGVYTDLVNANSTSVLNLMGTLTFGSSPSANFHVGWNGGHGQFLMTGSSLLNATGNSLYVGCGGLGATGLMSMSGNSTANIIQDMRFGDDEWGVGGGCSGSLTMSGNATINRSGGAYVIFGEGGGNTGVFSMSGNAKFLGVDATKQFITSIGHDGGMGTMTMQDNTQFLGAEVMIGQNTGVGVLNVSGGTFTAATERDNSWWYGWEATFEVGRWGGTGTASFSGNSVLNVVGRTNIGNEANGGVGSNVSNGSLTLSGNATMNTAWGPMRNYGWTWGDGGDIYVGCSEWENGVNATTQTLAGGVGALTVRDNATLNCSGQLVVGAHGGTGTVNVSGGQVTINGDTYIGLAGSNVGNYGYGTFTQTGGTVYVGALRIGYSSGANGVVNISGGPLTIGGDAFVGEAGGTGTMAVANSTVTCGGWFSIGGESTASAGTLTLNSGSVLNINNVLFLGRQGARGVLVANPGSVINVPNNPIFMAEVVSGGANYGEMDLNGCPLTARSFQMGWSTGTNANGRVYFNGSTVTCLQSGEFGYLAGGSGSTANHFFLNANGVTFNTNSYNVYTGFPLLAGTSTGGGVVKTGLGMLGLEGASTFTGPVNILQGTLFVGSSGNTASSIHASSGVNVYGGTIFSGSTATGTATMTPAVNVMTGGMLEPSLPSGTSAKNMYFAAGTLSAGALLLERVYSSSSLDQVTGTGTVACSGTTIVDFDLASAASVPTSTIKYLSAGTVTGTYSAIPAVDTALSGTTIYDITLAGSTGAGTKTVQFVADGTATAASRYWNDTNGVWNSDSNWTTGVANSTGHRAIFGSAISAALTVTLDMSPTVNSMIFQNANSYTISPSGSNFITLGGTLSAYASLAVYSGSHYITAPITLTNPLRVTVTAGSSTLNIGGAISGGSNGITLFGPGTLNLTGNNSFTGPIVMEGGMGGTQTGRGTLEIGSVNNGGVACPLGASSSDPSNLMLNGTLWFTGAAGTTDRGFTIAGQTIINTSTTAGGANSLTITGQVVDNFAAYRNFIKTGAGSLTLNYAGTEVVNHSDTYIEGGTLVFAGGGSSVYNFVAVNNSAVNMFVGDMYTTVTPGVTTAALAMTGGQVNVNTVYVGYQNTAGAQTGLTMSGGTLNTSQFFVGGYQDTSLNGAQVVNLSGTAYVLATSFAEIGSSRGADSYLNMSGNATLETYNQINFGQYGNATVVIDGNSKIQVDNAWVDIAPNLGACDFTMKGNSQFIQTGSAWDFTIGTGNNNTAVYTGVLGVFRVQDNALLKPAQNFYVGRWNYGAGAIYQSGGTVTSGGSGNYNWVIGGTDGYNNPYGYYNLSGGTFNSGASNLYISNTGVGVWDQTGGNAAAYQNVYLANQASGIAVMNVTGGTFTTLGTTNWGQGIFVGNQGRGVFNLGATGVVNTGAGDLWLTNSGNPGTAVGIANLGTTAQPGGDLITEGVWSGGQQTEILNFHGGTVTATQDEGSFIGNLTHVVVYSEGATIDPAGHSIGLIQSFEAPSGVGIQSIAVASGGIGYIGTPVVTISGGSGQGATAVANVSNGVITGLTITNPGSGYQPTDSLTVSISGIGALAPATAGGVTFNSGNSSGGLTLINSGVVAFCAPNTYTGDTVLAGPVAQLNAQVWDGSENVPVPAFAGNVVMNGSTLLLAEQPAQFGANSALSFLQYGEFVLNGCNETVAGLSDSTGKGIVENANTSLAGAPAGLASTLTVYTGAASSYYFNGLLRDNTDGTSGVLSLTKDGPGKLTLGGNGYGSGADTYTGVTTIANGTLALDATAAIPNSPLITIAPGAVFDVSAKTGFNIGAGQTLGGFGTVYLGSGKTLGFAGGTLAPGGSIGTLSIAGNLDLTGGVAAFELGAPGSSFSSPGLSDRVAVTGNLTLGGTLNLIDNAGHNGQGSAGLGLYRIFTYTGSESGAFSSVTGWDGGPTVHRGIVNSPADKAVYFSAFNYAVSSMGNPPPEVYKGKVFTGTPVTQSLTISNAASGVAEGLDASFGTPIGPISGLGSITNLDPGAFSTAMVIRLETSLAGHIHGSLPVNFASDGIDSGLDNTPLGSQPAEMSANVFDHGVASFDGTAMVDTLHLVLSGNYGDSVTQSYSIYNLMQTLGYTGSLDLVGWEAPVGGPVDPGLPPSPVTPPITIAAGAAETLVARLDTSTVGVFPTETITLHLTDSAADGIAGDTVNQTLVLTIDAQVVVPEPSTIILLAVALMGALAYAWRRR